MELYAGIDLHSNNNFLAVIDDQDKRLYQKRLPNQPDVVLAELAPFHEWISGIVGTDIGDAGAKQSISTNIAPSLATH